MTDKNNFNIFQVPEDVEDDGTMEENIASFGNALIGRKIVKVEKQEVSESEYMSPETATVFILDNGDHVQIFNSHDCCAYTELEAVIEKLPTVDHAITGVVTSDRYDTWHILADLNEIMELNVSWSPGNPFYYGYGFYIKVVKNNNENND